MQKVNKLHFFLCALCVLLAALCSCRKDGTRKYHVENDSLSLDAFIYRPEGNNVETRFVLNFPNGYPKVKGIDLNNTMLLVECISKKDDRLFFSFLDTLTYSGQHDLEEIYLFSPKQHNRRTGVNDANQTHHYIDLPYNCQRNCRLKLSVYMTAFVSHTYANGRTSWEKIVSESPSFEAQIDMDSPGETRLFASRDSEEAVVSTIY